MAHNAIELDPHPAVLYARERNWDYEATAQFLGIQPNRFRQIVRAFSGVSFRVADGWERKTNGQIRALDVFRWQERNRRPKPTRKRKAFKKKAGKGGRGSTGTPAAARDGGAV